MSRFPALILPLLLGCICASRAVRAADLEGTFVNETQSSAIIEAAIDKATATMSFVARPVARSRLKKVNPPYKRIVIKRTEQHTLVSYDTGAPIATPVQGTAVKWLSEDGETLLVSGRWEEDGVLTYTFTAQDGVRLNTFASRDGQTLTMTVAVRSDRLPAPIAYTLVFRRQPE